MYRRNVDLVLAGILFFGAVTILERLPTAGSRRNDIEIDVAEVKNWALQFGQSIHDGSIKATCLQKITDNFQQLNASVESVDGSELLNGMRLDIKNVLFWKKMAVQIIAEVAEHAAAGHQYNKLIKHEFYNAVIKEEKKQDDLVLDEEAISKKPKPKKSVKDLELKPHKNFAHAPVNFHHSSVHVPTNVFNEDPEVLNAIKWSEYLNPAFRNNLAVDPFLNWQYFGSSTGFLRTYPATEWAEEGREKPDLYDCRTRFWYVKAAASPKDVVILVDISGSMTGNRKEIARNVVTDILSTLTEDDYVSILKFHNETTPVVPCFEENLVQANEENIREFQKHMKKIETERIANFTLSLITAFELLEAHKQSGLGSLCNQAIMIITDGAPDTYEEIFEQYNYPNIPVRVFTYLIGKEVTETHEVTVMACQNKGLYSQMATLPEVRDKVLKYVPILSRPIVLSSKRPFIWTSVYADVPATELSFAEWEDREFEIIRQKLNAMRRHMWFAAQEDDKLDDPDSTPEPIMTDKVVRPLQLMTTVATPVFDKKMKIPNLLGVAGIDVPVREILKLTKPYKIGVNAYTFAVTNNGHVLYHPDLRPLFQDLLKPGYRNIDLTQVEQVNVDSDLYENEETLLSIRNDMVDQKIGSGKMSIKIHTEDFKRVVIRNNSYYFGPIDGTPFSLAVSLPEPYGHNRVVGKVPVKGKGKEDALKYFQGENWRIHPDWVYCERPQKDDDGYTSPEENISAFLSTLNFSWRSNSTGLPTFDKPLCDRELIESLVFDAKATLINCFESNNKFDEEFVGMFGLSATFVSTRSGLMRYYEYETNAAGANDTKENGEEHISDVHTRATEEEFYKRAVEFHNVNNSAFVFSVPLDAGEDDKVDFVTASRAIFLGSGNKTAPVAVVGLQFYHTVFADRFFYTTSKCMGSCRYTCNDDELDCFLLDNNAFIVVSENKDQTGKFFGEIDYLLLDRMTEIGIYNKIHVYDYQAVCIEIKVRGFAPYLLTPFHHMRNLFNWLWSKLALYYVQFSLYEWWSREWVMASGDSEAEDVTTKVKQNTTIPYPCEKEIDLYEMLPQDFAEPVKDKLPDCHSSGCDKHFLVQQVPYTNLILLVVSNTCPCEPTSISLEADEVKQNETLRCERIKENIHRSRPNICHNYHPDEVSLTRECGGSSQVERVGFLNLLLGLTIFYYMMCNFHI